MGQTTAERELEDSAVILIAIWFREGPAMTQQLNLNHGHPDGEFGDKEVLFSFLCQRLEDCMEQGIDRVFEGRVAAPCDECYL